MVHIKRFFGLLLICIALLPTFLVPEVRVSAKTVRDLENELNKYIEDQRKNQNEQQQTEQEITNTKANIDNINATINQMGEEVKQINEELVKLNEDIEAKDKEIKSIINFLQVANGESEYLEYAFGAQSFTDFIYRVAVTEQLTNYNDELIDEFNQMITDKNNRKEALRLKEIDLNKQQEKLKVELKKLGSKMTSLYDISADLDETIKAQKEIIQNYKDRGCKLDDNIDTCGRGVLPNNTRFWRPIAYGQITSHFGNRCFWLNGSYTCDFHTGLDLSGSGLGSPIYATASGTVALVDQIGCGGNYVLIHHKVNGQYYTSMYMHLYQVYVKTGDFVDKNTVIATMGGDPGVTWWDGCSTGAHLHFTLMNGLAGTDFWMWSDGFYANIFNPQYAVNLPSGYWYDDRITWYK